MVIQRLEGEMRSGPATILTAGKAARLFARRLYRGEVRTTDLETVPLLQLDAWFRDHSPTADLTLSYLDKWSAHFLFAKNYMRIPDWIDVELKVPEEIENLWRGNENLKKDIRRVRREGISLEVSQREEDFDAFYKTMYLPFIAARHGDMARPRDIDWLEGCFRRGKLLWAVQSGQRMAAVVIEIGGGVLHFWAVATRDGNAQLLKQGMLSALYLFAIEHAQLERCSSVHFGGCQALLGDGILRYKRKWGAGIKVQQDNPDYYLLHWHKWNHAAETLLTDLSPIHEQDSHLEAISALAMPEAAGQRDLEQLHRYLLTPGIDRYLTVNARGWQADVIPPASVILGEGEPDSGTLTGMFRKK